MCLCVVYVFVCSVSTHTGYICIINKDDLLVHGGIPSIFHICAIMNFDFMLLILEQVNTSSWNTHCLVGQTFEEIQGKLTATHMLSPATYMLQFTCVYSILSSACIPIYCLHCAFLH